MFSLPKSEVPAQCIWSSFALDIFSAFINLYNHLFTSVWAHGYLFCTLGYKPMLLYFVAQIALALAIGRSFSLAPFDIPFSLLFLEYFLSAPSLPCIFPA